MTVETFDTIRQWAHDTFGVAAPERTIDRANEEMVELIDAEDPQHIVEEAADVVITLCNLPGLAEAIEAKMKVNRARKWLICGDGTGYHA